MNRPSRLPAALLAIVASGCAPKTAAPLLGTLEWDRIGVAADSAEPIVHITVAEGDAVRTGDTILTLDTRRADAALAQAQGQERKAEAALAELRHGARAETIDAARAALAGAEATRANAQRERERVAEVRRRGLVAQAALDQADTALRTARAQADGARANLAELLHGARIEDLDQAEADLAAAQATVAQLALTRERLDVRAPRDGRVDALPFKLGDQPPAGATVVSLLAGDAPYARVYVPADRRAALAEGARCRVTVTGVAQAFEAHVRSLRSEAAFTPYYALSGDDASRLVYRAELLLDGDAARRLPAGLPAQAECDAAAR